MIISDLFKRKSCGDELISEQKSEYDIKVSAIRLCYVSFDPFIGYDDGMRKVGQTYGISSSFKVPNGMSIEDVCKVVSYLSDKVEKENGLEPACERSVIMVSNILEDYGFKKIETKNKGHFHSVSQYDSFQTITTSLPASGKVAGVVDLFSVDGSFKIFKKSDLFNRYFEWYTEGVTSSEVADIYNNINKTEELEY